ncbi:arylamine N-acetyltransferase family protein [Saccharothrix syringae]|uniref:Arylamine N-acetyltransferase n=1 Tax=Saccharothrix syringae TaxID=103733 RepID=A0A5Q0GW76_SACSY|nr:arylamine N-acetyltransferase [Saccharothrix syringae]QFZ17602.1 arylamine N-acetyltransferase [Saccharothrix syringae]
MDQRTLDAYLALLGATRADTVADLHERHVRTVPFENLSIHLGEEIGLDEDRLVDKVVNRRRGGFCYELNGAFAALLRALGHDVVLLAARVFNNGSYGPPLAHVALRVGDLLVDVGFGRSGLRPLDLTDRGDQHDEAGVFRLADTPEGDVEVLLDGERQYRLELRPRELEEFRAMCWYQQHYPASPFRRAPMCTLPTPTGRITIAGTKLITTDGDGKREEELDDDALLAAYAKHFGIELDRVPGLT